MSCTDCHAGMGESLIATPHAALHSETQPDVTCVKCHGDGTEHMKNPAGGNVIAFTDETALVKDAACSSCHVEQRNAGHGAHALAGLSCTDCHSTHSQDAAVPALPGHENLKSGSAQCVGCHADTLAEFGQNKRHRLLENSLTCVSCHDPHDRPVRLQLGSIKEKTCSKCHADKDGPFIFEHAASRVDGCLACHSAHGSANRHLLQHQKVGELCYSCHALVPQFHVGFSPSAPPRFGLDTMCTNCHTTIHGSNFNRLFLK